MAKKTKSSDKDLKVEVKAEAEVKKAEPKGMNYDAMSPKQRREYDWANKKWLFFLIWEIQKN